MFKYILLITIICLGFVGCQSNSGCKCRIPHCTCEISQQAKDMCYCQDYLDKDGNKLQTEQTNGS